MPAAKRLTRDLPIRTPVEAVEQLWAERARVKMNANVHLGLARRVRSSAAPLTGPGVIKTYNASLFGTYIPWAKALNLNVVFIDGDIEEVIDSPQTLVSFIEAAVARRGYPMTWHRRACKESGGPGERAIKEIKMGNALDIQLNSLMTHKNQLGFAIVLRAA